MKKYLKIALLVVVAIILVGTFCVSLSEIQT